MAKYHIKEDYSVGLCTAKPGNCPFGSDEEYHFPTIEEARARANEIAEMEDEQRWLRALPPRQLLRMAKITESAGKINELNVCRGVVDKLEEIYPSTLHIPSKLSPQKREELERVLKLAMPDSTHQFPANLIWETEEHYFIWTNDVNYLDMITVLKDSGRVTSMEIKDLSKNAQISTITLSQNEDGQLSADDSFFDDKETQQKIDNFFSEYDPTVDSMTNKRLPLTREEELEYFIRLHTKKGCTKLGYKDENGNIKYIFFKSWKTGNIKDDVKEMLARNIEVKVWIRQNNRETARNLSQLDVNRFHKKYGDFFKTKQASSEFTFRDLNLKDDVVKFDLNLDKDKKTKPYIRIGEFIYIGKSGERIEPTETISFENSFKRMAPLLTGEIGFIKNKQNS